MNSDFNTFREFCPSPAPSQETIDCMCARVLLLLFDVFNF